MAGTCTQLERPGLSWRTGEISLWDWESGCHGFSDNRVLLCHLERSRKICIELCPGAARAVMASLEVGVRFTRLLVIVFRLIPSIPFSSEDYRAGDALTFFTVAGSFARFLLRKKE